MKSVNYIIITPAFNEEKYIAETIKSVLLQTIKPKLWVIVDDGSTDQTANIINEYANQHPWIQYVYRSKESGQTYYASNVCAILEGIKEVSSISFEYLAILDADISLFDNYYQTIFQLFSQDPRLGIVSGSCADRIGDTLKTHLYDRRSCAKAIMVFRKECFDQIGGFVPMRYGGEDTVACFTARMLGWKTWAYYELLVIHNKPLGTGPSSDILKIRFRQGIGEYYRGSHPLFVFLKFLRRCVKESPYVIGGLSMLVGFIRAHWLGEERQISDELVRFIRKEQICRVFRSNKIPVEYEVKK